MVLTPSGFTYEHLNSLKFKELQKLSVQFRVNKRWAKKQELIENLLAIKPSGHLDNEITTESQLSDEWRDGSIVFHDLKPVNPEEGSPDKRLTFNVNKPSNIDSRLTFDVPPKEASLLCEKNSTSTYSRETYEVSQKKDEFELEPLMESRATYRVPQNKPLLPEIDTRATYEVPQNDNDHFQQIQNELKSIEKNSEMSNNEEPSKHYFIRNSVPVKTSAKDLASLKSGPQSIKKTDVKMLTIPYSKVPRRYKKDTENGKNNNLLSKLSQKSINIKKTKLPTKLDMIKSPTTIRKPAEKQQTIKSHPKFQPNSSVPSKIPTILSFSERNPLKADQLEKPRENNKENSNRILRRRKSKTADEVLIKKPNIQAKVNFMSPPVTSNRNHRPLLPINKTPMTKDNNDHLTRKPITAKKMPNFNKIHQKQFEQMDSLPDYLKKKEERTRKLFGTPLQASQQKTPKPATVFKFQSSAAVNLESKFAKSTENLRNVKGKTQKDTVKNRLPPSKLQIDAKDKSRNHIIGVRTNKRFELQMKLRNM